MSQKSFFCCRVPEVVVLKQHVLVMSFIGSEGRPAPKLKDAVERLTKAEVARAYGQVEEMMVNLYNICHLVHADLSEYNILWFDAECWFIDVSLWITIFYIIDFSKISVTSTVGTVSMDNIRIPNPPRQGGNAGNFF